MSATKVQIKYGYGTPAPGSLKLAELAIDLNDDSLWTADSDGNIVRVGHNTDEIEIDIEQIIEELKYRVLHNDERNVIEEGTFQIVWRDDDPNYDSFTGTIGYNRGASDEPNSMEGSFIFAEGVNEKTGLQATLSIGRDADLELKGDNAIRGISDRSGTHRPIIEGFKYIQADEFIGDGSKLTGIGGGGGGAVDSVNGKTGAVVLSASDVGAEPVFSKNSAFNKNFGNTNGTVAQGNHTHSQYLTTETDPTVPTHVKSISQSDIDKWNAGGSGSGGAVDSVNGKTGVVVLEASDVGAEPAFSKNNAFNKNFGTTSTTVAKGNHKHPEYLESYTETDPTVPAHVKSISQTDIDKWNNPPSGGGGKTYTGDNGVTVNNTTDKISMSGSYTGDLSVSGNVTAAKFLGTYIYRDSACGLAFSYGQAVLPADGAGASVDSAIDLGQTDKKWKDGWFSGTVTAGGDIIAFSDARLKDNVETLDGSKVFEMRGVSFTKDGKEGSGVIAQEIQKVAPELVSDDGEYLGVAYGNLVGYLIEAVKELKAEIESLKNG